MRIKSLMAGAAIGLAASLSAMSAGAADLVTNGSFETGDFTGWTQFGDTSWNGVGGGNQDLGYPTDGVEVAYFGPVTGVSGISQELATGAGLYNISFDLSNDAGTFFSADFGGVTLLLSPPSEGVTHYSFTDVAASGPTTLTFSFVDVPAFYTLDNVQVTAAAVPEPASWALMIGGFFGLGATLRGARRRTAAAAA